MELFIKLLLGAGVGVGLFILLVLVMVVGIVVVDGVKAIVQHIKEDKKDPNSP